MQNYECWHAATSLMLYTTLLNWFHIIVMGVVVWWIMKRQAPSPPGTQASTPASVLTPVPPDEYDDETLVQALRTATPTTPLNRSTASVLSPSPKIQEVTEVLRTITSNIGSTTDLTDMSGTLMETANNISGIINEDETIPRDKKHELVQILASVPDFMRRVSEITGGPPTRPDEGEHLMAILDSLK